MSEVLASQSDIALMSRVALGFHDAFEILVERHQAGVITFCFSFMRDNQTAEDLAQETFLRVYRAAKRYKPTAKFTTWLYRIAANLCINELKKGKLRRTLSLDDHVGLNPDESRIVDKIAGDTPQPLTEVENRELQKIIAKAIDHLPDEQRTTLILVEYHHMSYKEIAEILEVSVSAVKMRMKRARESLREILKVIEHEYTELR